MLYISEVVKSIEKRKKNRRIQTKISLLTSQNAISPSRSCELLTFCAVSCKPTTLSNFEWLINKSNPPLSSTFKSSLLNETARWDKLLHSKCCLNRVNRKKVKKNKYSVPLCHSNFSTNRQGKRDTPYRVIMLSLSRKLNYYSGILCALCLADFIYLYYSWPASTSFCYLRYQVCH